MVVVPVAIPVTTPVPEPMVAMPAALLVQSPPPSASVRGIVPPTHTVVGPVMAGGMGFTVTGYVAAHPVEVKA